MNKYIIEGFFSELEKVAITRPAIEWYPFDHNDEGPMLHRTANSSMFTEKQYSPGALKRMRKKHYDKKWEEPKEEYEDNDEDDSSVATDHAHEISDEQTAKMISPEYRYRNPYK